MYAFKLHTSNPPSNELVQLNNLGLCIVGWFSKVICVSSDKVIEVLDDCFVQIAVSKGNFLD